MFFRFASIFVVVPFITKEPEIFGIYSVCLSLGIFFNYADLGFLKATKKYGAECYARGERLKEMQFLGFGSFILLILTLILTAVIFYLGFYPDILIDGLSTPKTFSVASKLLITLAIFTPFTIFRRLIEMIFLIRLEPFISKKVFLLGSIVTLCSSFYFFGGNNYLIVSYFLFFKIIDVISIIICFVIAKVRYNYDLLLLFRCIRFDKKIYVKAFRLAYSGLFIMLAWVLFYELDQLFIGKYFGAEKVGIYAIALAFPILLRQIFGVIFGPFVERANHLVGLNEVEGLKKLIFKIIVISAPVTIMPTLALSLVAKPLILSWVGIDYAESINIGIMLCISYSLSFITYTTDIVLLAKEKIKEIYIIATIPAVIFWSGIFLTISSWGLLSIGIFKLIATVIVQFSYISILIKFLNISLINFLKKVIIPLIIPISFMIIFILIVDDFLFINKSKIGLIFNIISSGIIGLVSMLLLYFTSSEVKTFANDIYFTNLGAKK